MNLGAIEIYLLEASLFLILLYIFNKLLLGHDTLHRFNRYVWLATIVISLSLPLMVRDRHDSMIFAADQQIDVDVDIAQFANIAEDLNEISPLEVVVNLIFAIYLIGVVALIIHNAILHISLIRVLRRSPKLSNSPSSPEDSTLLSQFRYYEREMGLRFKVRYIIHNENISPFSWFNYVVVSRKDIANGMQHILFHELSHVKQLHSWDIVFMNLATIVLWFNPAVWLTKRAIQQVHEYCADEAVLERGVNTKEYQLLLIKTSVGSRHYSISNTLNHSNLKNRITMMLKKKNSKVAAAKCLLSIPVLSLALLLLSEPVVARVRQDVSDAKVTKKSDTKVDNEQKTDKDEPFLFVETMPKFMDGDLSTFRQWVMSRIRYPKEAAMNGVTGRVIASFIIEKSGKLNQIKILNSPDKSFSDEVIRILNESPKWTPGVQRGKRVQLKFTIPIQFNLNKPLDGEIPQRNPSDAK